MSLFAFTVASVPKNRRSRSLPELASPAPDDGMPLFTPGGGLPPNVPSGAAPGAPSDAAGDAAAGNWVDALVRQGMPEPADDDFATDGDPALGDHRGGELGGGALGAGGSATAAGPGAADERSARRPGERGAGDAQSAAPLTVAAVNRQANALISQHFGELSVSAEISAINTPSSGHWYITLKGDEAELRCVMFRGDNARLGFVPKVGEQLIVHGKLGLFEARGQFQLVASGMERQALGALLRALEALKQRLAKEGLFERKRPLPAWTRHIALITSPDGAAIHDICQVLARRFPLMAVTLLPVPVQGEMAAAKISAAIDLANQRAARQQPPFDLILLARGGGGAEDLAAFNDEALARAVAASALVVVTGIGHETDHSIADYVADQRAPTPSAAAELISPDGEALRAQCDAAQQRMRQRAETCLASSRQRRRDTARRMRDPAPALRERQKSLAALAAAQQRCAQNALRQRTQRLDDLGRGLRHPAATLRERRERLESWRRRCGAGAELALAQRQEHAARAARQLAHETLLGAERASAQWRLADTQLRGIGPESTLKRGYAILQRRNGELLRAAGDAQVGERLAARLGSGRLSLQVTGHETPARADGAASGAASGAAEG